MPFIEDTIEKEVVLKNPIFTLVKHKVHVKNGGTSTRYVIEHKGAVAIAATTPEGKLLLEKQFRKALDTVVWEIPAGKIDPEEQPCEFTGANGQKAYWLGTGKRELKEETGWEAEDWQPLTTMCGSVGYTNEKIEIWKARCTIKGETNFDYGEDVDLYEFTLPEVLAMVDRGEIYDAKTVIAVLMLAREAGLK